MWISWHYLDPIMHDLGLLPSGTEIISPASKDSPIIEYSAATKTLYVGVYTDPYGIGIKTIKEFNQVLMLYKLGMSRNEIQQQIYLGRPDDT